MRNKFQDYHVNTLVARNVLRVQLTSLILGFEKPLRSPALLVGI